jgi:hypothetical protein
MGQQLAKRPVAERLPDHPPQPRVDAVVQPQASRFQQAEHRGRREGLGVRRDAEQVRRCELAPLPMSALPCAVDNTSSSPCHTAACTPGSRSKVCRKASQLSQ